MSYAYRLLPYARAAAWIIGSIIFCFVFRPRLKLTAGADILGARMSFCVSILDITVFCNTLAFEGGAPVLYDGKGVPAFISVSGGRERSRASDFGMLALKKVRLDRAKLYAAFGAEDAAVTATAAGVLNILSAAIFFYLKKRGIASRGADLRRGVIPVYGKSVFKLYITGIIGISLANIIISLLRSLFRKKARAITNKNIAKYNKKSVIL